MILFVFHVIKICLISYRNTFDYANFQLNLSVAGEYFLQEFSSPYDSENQVVNCAIGK